MSWLKGKKALLLDMNSTFMFGEDRFDDAQDFSRYYQKMGGRRCKTKTNAIIRAVYEYLGEKYPDPRYMHCFPSVENAIFKVTEGGFSKEETHRLIDTFAFHELGDIPKEYVNALFLLRNNFVLSAVIDIWSPKKFWIETFNRLKIETLFSAISFSSDHGVVKPSPRPFERIVAQLNLPKAACLVIGDSARRDLGGAKAAGIDCILIGDLGDAQALACFPSLLAFCDEIK